MRQNKEPLSFLFTDESLLVCAFIVIITNYQGLVKEKVIRKLTGKWRGIQQITMLMMSAPQGRIDGSRRLSVKI